MKSSQVYINFAYVYSWNGNFLDIVIVGQSLSSFSWHKALYTYRLKRQGVIAFDQFQTNWLVSLYGIVERNFLSILVFIHAFVHYPCFVFLCALFLYSDIIFYKVLCTVVFDRRSLDSHLFVKWVATIFASFWSAVILSRLLLIFYTCIFAPFECFLVGNFGWSVVPPLFCVRCLSSVLFILCGVLVSPLHTLCHVPHDTVFCFWSQRCEFWISGLHILSFCRFY